VRTEYASKVSFEARAGDELAEVSITTSGPYEETRIISVMNCSLDLIPGKYVFVQSYEDKPGQLGKIGTILGEAGVNISTMEIGLKPGTSTAYILMNVDQAIDAELRQRIETAVGSSRGWFIEL